MADVYEQARGFTPRKEVQIVAYENGPDFLRDLIFNSRKEKFYLSHPITGEEEDSFKRFTKFATSLKDYYIVYDPIMIKDWEIVECWRDALNSAREGGHACTDTVRYSTAPAPRRSPRHVEVEAVKNLDSR
jgi:hypothetical protein